MATDAPPRRAVKPTRHPHPHRPRKRPHRPAPAGGAGSSGTRIASFWLMAMVSVLMITPFVWMVLSSLRDPAQSAGLLPESLRWQNYADALKSAPFLTYARNSFFIAAGHTVINVVFASMAGYALAKLPFRGSKVLLFCFIGAIMIPMYTIIVPQFILVRSMPFFGGNDILGQGGTGWLDSWWALIIPGAMSPLSVFLFRQFYLGIPKELAEAARLDGANEFVIWAKIVTPQVKPAIVTVALLTFQTGWTNFLWPLLVTGREDLRVLQVGLASFQQENTTQWALLMAGTAMATIPMIVLFVFAQRYFVNSLTHVGLK
ncbi:carbohydrate ABC transporter permease [Streptomyces sp. NPDC057287]|uniref:carbohydrate ABC transporter permease n=1 Tax=Streptomyces sp. NPDC057287 TaxID=3346086 RepID=UPI00362F5850